MLTSDIFKTINVFLLPLVFLDQAFSQTAPDWSYRDTNWAENYTQCNGKYQSPLQLGKHLHLHQQPIRFVNYDVPLLGDYEVVNDGRSITMNVPTTKNGQRPFITGGSLGKSKFEAVSLHFHWGSKGVKGSEHIINGRRYDVEMHVVHINAKYNNMDEATNCSDGLSVLATLYQVDRSKNKHQNDLGLRSLLEKLPLLINYRSSAIIEGPYNMKEFIGNVDQQSFLIYNGSLTTPPCSENVVWNVLSKPLPMSLKHIKSFYNLLDENKQPLINTFRLVQKREKRPSIYKSFGLIY